MTARNAFAAFARANRINATRMGFPCASVAVINGRKIEFSTSRGNEFRPVRPITKSERIAHLTRKARFAQEVKDKAEYCFILCQMQSANDAL